MQGYSHWCIEKGEGLAHFRLANAPNKDFLYFWIEAGSDMYQNNTMQFETEADALRYMMHPSRQFTEDLGYRAVLNQGAYM